MVDPDHPVEKTFTDHYMDFYTTLSQLHRDETGWLLVDSTKDMHADIHGSEWVKPTDEDL